MRGLVIGRNKLRLIVGIFTGHCIIKVYLKGKPGKYIFFKIEEVHKIFPGNNFLLSANEHFIS